MHQLLLATLLILVLAAPALSWEPMTLGTSDTQESAATKTHQTCLLAECFHRLEYRLTILNPSQQSAASWKRTKATWTAISPGPKPWPRCTRTWSRCPNPSGPRPCPPFRPTRTLRSTGGDSLAGFHVAWVDGREICNRHLGQAPHKTLEQNEVALLRFVGEKRAEVGIMGRDRGRELLKRLGIAHVRPLEPPLEEGQLYPLPAQAARAHRSQSGRHAPQPEGGRNA